MWNKKGFRRYSKIENEFSSNGLPVNCFIQHPLNADNFILDIPRMVNDACITLNQGNSLISIPLNEQQKDILQKAIDSLKL